MVDEDDDDNSDDDDDNTDGDGNNTEEKNDEILDRTNEDINDYESDCSSETLRRRYSFAKDGGDLLNTYFFFSVKNGEIDDLRIESTDEELFRLRKDLDEVKIDAESLDEVDNDNDDIRDDKNVDYDKDGDDDDTNVDNNEVDNPRVEDGSVSSDDDDDDWKEENG